MNTLLHRWEKQAIPLLPPTLPSFDQSADEPTTMSSDVPAQSPSTTDARSSVEPTPALWTPPTRKAAEAPINQPSTRKSGRRARRNRTPPAPAKPPATARLILPPTPDSHRRLALFAEAEWREKVARRAAPAIAESDSTFDLLDLMIATKKEMAQQEATQLAAINELGKKYPGHLEFLPTEVAMALLITDREAESMFDLAYYLPRRYPETWSQLQGGHIRADFAKIVHQHLELCTDEVAAKVDEIVGPKLSKLRSGQVSRLMIKTILEVDAAGVHERHKKRRADRHVYRRSTPDGMGHLGIYSTVADINIIFEGLTAAGETAWSPGDPRTNNQRRIDAVVDLMRRSLDSGTLPPSIHHGPPAEMTDTSTDFIQPSDTRKRTAGLAPADASTPATPLVVVRETAAAGPAGQLVPTEGAAANGAAADGAAADRNIRHKNADGSATGADSSELSSVAENFLPETPEVAFTEPCLECGHRPTGAEEPPPPPARRGMRSAPKYSIGVLIPLNTLLGGNDPGYITGQGWITPHQARILATDHTWRRILTDPVNEQIINIGRKRYRPPASMAEFVRTRDQYCAAPGCTSEAMKCALDHVEPFRPGEKTGGSTSVDNLKPTCEHHHRAKDGGGFTLRRTKGVFEWTTPMERTYMCDPERPWLPGPNSPHHPANWDAVNDHEFDERLFTQPDITDPSEPIVDSGGSAASTSHSRLKNDAA